MPQDEYETVQFDRLIQDVRAGYGREATLHHRAQPHAVLWFALGLGLWLVDAILLYAFVWFLRHG